MRKMACHAKILASAPKNDYAQRLKVDSAYAGQI